MITTAVYYTYTLVSRDVYMYTGVSYVRTVYNTISIVDVLYVLKVKVHIAHIQGSFQCGRGESFMQPKHSTQNNCQSTVTHACEYIHMHASIILYT